MRIEGRLEAMCHRAAINPNSFQGIRFTQAFLLSRISHLSARLTSWEKSARGPSGSQSQVARLSKEPMMESREELENMSFLSQETLEWIASIGGSSAKDHIYRVLNGLMSHSLQRQINMKGSYGKAKFPDCLNKAVSESTRKLFPTETVASVEELIRKFFKNSIDRAGGRKARSASVTKPLPSKSPATLIYHHSPDSLEHETDDDY